MLDKKKQGKRNRAKGGAFELRVRKDLEKQGYIALKNPLKYNITEQKLEHCKPKFNPITKSLMMNSGGFPDLIRWRPSFEVYLEGVEVKTNGYLNPEEREMCRMLLKNYTLSKIYIASKDKRKIIYEDFEVKYGRTSK